MQSIYAGLFVMCCFVLGATHPATATVEQNFQFNQGMNAYNAGQYEKAFKLLLPIAEDDSYQFSGTAKYVIAQQFELGQGVTQNMEAAISW